MRSSSGWLVWTGLDGRDVLKAWKPWVPEGEQLKSIVGKVCRKGAWDTLKASSWISAWLADSSMYSLVRKTNERFPLGRLIWGRKGGKEKERGVLSRMSLWKQDNAFPEQIIPPVVNAGHMTQQVEQITEKLKCHLWPSIWGLCLIYKHLEPSVWHQWEALSLLSYVGGSRAAESLGKAPVGEAGPLARVLL